MLSSDFFSLTLVFDTYGSGNNHIMRLRTVQVVSMGFRYSGRGCRLVVSSGSGYSVRRSKGFRLAGNYCLSRSRRKCFLMADSHPIDLSGYATSSSSSNKSVEEPDMTTEPKLTTADRLRKGWWNIAYGFIGLYCLLDAPQLSLVKMNFLIKFARHLRDSGFMMLFAFQGLISLTYSPLTKLIKIKFGQANPYDTHRRLFEICIAAYAFIFVCFGILLLLIIHGQKNSARYHFLSVITLVSVALVPMSLIGLILVPADFMSRFH